MLLCAEQQWHLKIQAVGTSAGGSDKCAVTLTLTVTLDEKFLPLYMRYGEKTKQSLPRITFPKGFGTGYNETP